MNRDKWIWMPHAAHFIGASRCQFRMATYVGRYIVSTVGEYMPHYTAGQMEELGSDRMYETMVFKAVRSKAPGHCEACSWSITNAASNLDFDGYKEPQAAFKGHMKLCAKWAKL